MSLPPPRRRSPLWGVYDAQKRARRLAEKVLTDREFSRLILERDVWCQAEDLGHDCGGRARHAHHVLPRSRGGQNTLPNGLGVCAAGHAAIHAHPIAARAVGYLK